MRDRSCTGRKFSSILAAAQVWLAFFLLLITHAAAQTSPALSTGDLYRQLSSVGLDPSQVYKLRDISIDREDMHISFVDGTAAFTHKVNGVVTGMLFVGEGEVLVVPPNQVERQSLALFTKSAVLSEKFSVAYIRFHDAELINDLQSGMRAEKAGAAEFVEKHDSVARTLAENGALRALLSSGYQPQSPNDRAADFLYLRLSGMQLGIFDLSLDRMLDEQVTAGQVSFTDNGRFYDRWTSFAMRSVRPRRGETAVAVPESDDFVHITAYDIRTKVRPPTDLSSEATLSIEVVHGGYRTLLFELSRYLKTTSVMMEIEGAEPVPLDLIQNQSLDGSELARRGNDVVAVVFPRALKAGERLKLRFQYGGAVMSSAGGGLLYVGARGTWYPNRGPWMSDYSLEFHHPADWKLLATGQLVTTRKQDATEISQWKSEQPIPLAGFNLGRYFSASSTSNAASGAVVVSSHASRAMEDAFPKQRVIITREAPLTRTPQRPVEQAILLPPPDPAENARKVAESSSRTIEFLAPRLGPFPYKALHLTQMPGSSSQGWPGLVFLSSYAFLSPSQLAMNQRNVSYQILYDRVMLAHETAHQWWGDNVFWRSYRDQWIMEALANYCALMQLETEDPEKFQAVMQTYRRALEEKSPLETDVPLPLREAGPVSLGLRLNSSKFAGAYDDIVYGRGTWLIHMLRHMYRDAGMTGLARGRARKSDQEPDRAFFQILRGIQTRYRGKAITTTDFRAAFEAELPEDLRFENQPSLEWFFQHWVDGTAMPRLQLQDVKISTGAKPFASFTLRQKEAPDLMVTSVPIYAVVGNASPVLVKRVFADGEETSLRLAVPAGTRRLLLDPYQTVLTSLK